MAEITTNEADQRRSNARILDVREDAAALENNGMAFKDKTLVFSQPGALNATGLEEVIQAVKNLDMDKLRADSTQQQP